MSELKKKNVIMFRIFIFVWNIFIFIGKPVSELKPLVMFGIFTPAVTVLNRNCRHCHPGNGNCDDSVCEQLLLLLKIPSGRSPYCDSNIFRSGAQSGRTLLNANGKSNLKRFLQHFYPGPSSPYLCLAMYMRMVNGDDDGDWW